MCLPRRRPALQRASSDPQHAAKLAALDREEQLMQVCRATARSLPDAAGPQRARCAGSALQLPLAVLSQPCPPFPAGAWDGHSSPASSCSAVPPQEDLALLQQFAEDDAINYKGQRLVAK
jgi:hypothetical protein